MDKLRMKLWHARLMLKQIWSIIKIRFRIFLRKRLKI